MAELNADDNLAKGLEQCMLDVRDLAKVVPRRAQVGYSRPKTRGMPCIMEII